jgi:GPI mannosyltransferase 2
MIVLPFLYHHYAAYLAFCRPHPALDAATPGWCNNFPPSIYAHVQSTYWHVGFLSYWTIAQIPNFLLASPILALLISYSGTCLMGHMKNVFTATEPSRTSVSLTVDPPASMLPHAIHALILSFTLLFASHVQIALRLASSMPIVYWAAAALIVRRVDGNKRTSSAWSWGYAWVSWSVIWGAVSVVLWTVFLPPA